MQQLASSPPLPTREVCELNKSLTHYSQARLEEMKLLPKHKKLLMQVAIWHSEILLHQIYTPQEMAEGNTKGMLY